MEKGQKELGNMIECTFPPLIYLNAKFGHSRTSLVAQLVNCNAGEPGLIPGSGRSAKEGNGNPLQYSCLENPMDREASWAIVNGVSKESDRTE